MVRMHDDAFSKTAKDLEELHERSLDALKALQEKQRRYIRAVLRRIDPKQALVIRQKLKLP